MDVREKLAVAESDIADLQQDAKERLGWERKISEQIGTLNERTKWVIRITSVGTIGTVISQLAPHIASALGLK